MKLIQRSMDDTSQQIILMRWHLLLCEVIEVFLGHCFIPNQRNLAETGDFISSLAIDICNLLPFEKMIAVIFCQVTFFSLSCYLLGLFVCLFFLSTAKSIWSV